MRRRAECGYEECEKNGIGAVKLSVEAITDRFRESGRKVTPQRAAVFEVVCEHGGHPTVDQIYRQVRKRFPMISLNTVYQIMEALVEMKIVSPVGHGQEAARYETDPTSHHHAVCITCKRIIDIFDAGLGRIKPPRAIAQDQFHVVGHRVEFFGYCADCQAAREVSR
jgi:Fur family peroxide stress response transcriptional regulator